MLCVWTRKSVEVTGSADSTEGRGLGSLSLKEHQHLPFTVYIYPKIEICVAVLSNLNLSIEPAGCS